jgi:hypothetical protein
MSQHLSNRFSHLWHATALLNKDSVGGCTPAESLFHYALDYISSTKHCNSHSHVHSPVLIYAIISIDAWVYRATHKRMRLVQLGLHNGTL